MWRTVDKYAPWGSGFAIVVVVLVINYLFPELATWLGFPGH